ncbi:MAG: hypothetical protein U0S48_11135 [Solirubrobacteraceae bacterium]
MGDRDRAALLWSRTPAPAAFVLGVEAGNLLMHAGMAIRGAATTRAW